MPRFALLIHDHPFLHWDLLLEHGAACRAWRLLVDPGSSITEMAAEQLPDHRLIYLDYEGPVSRQRGTVQRWDAGLCEWRIDEAHVCEVVVEGTRWVAIVRLERQIDQTWLCTRRQ